MRDGFTDINAMRECARQILRWWDRDHERPFKMKTEFAHGAGPIIWAYATHTAELTRTIIELSEQKRMAVAAPLIRLMIELGMTSSRLYLSPGSAAKALHHESERQRRATINDVVQTGHTEYGLEMYVMWRMFSRLSHATVNLADNYFIEIPPTLEAPLGLALNSEGDNSTRDSSLGLAICMLLVALKACDLVDDEGRRTTQLKQAARRVGITLDFKLTRDDAQ